MAGKDWALFVRESGLLPEGWTVEDYCGSVVVTRPSMGSASLNFERREAYGWYVSRHHRTLTSTKYTGRGWAERLIADAVKWLQEIHR